jgi:hypothetical protein
MPEAQPTCACTLDEQLTPMGRAVVNATQGDEVVRIIFTALRTSHQIVNIDEPRVMAARHRAAAVIAMDHTAPQGSDRFRQAIRDRKMKPVIGSTPSVHESSEESRPAREALPGRGLLPQPRGFRAIATRFETTARNFLALTQLACAWLWLDETRDTPLVHLFAKHARLRCVEAA